MFSEILHILKDTHFENHFQLHPAALNNHHHHVINQSCVNVSKAHLAPRQTPSLETRERRGSFLKWSIKSITATHLWHWSYNHQLMLHKPYQYHDEDPASHPASRFSVRALIRDLCKSSRLQSKPRVWYPEPTQMGAHNMDQSRMPRTRNGSRYNLGRRSKPG